MSLSQPFKTFIDSMSPTLADTEAFDGRVRRIPCRRKASMEDRDRNSSQVGYKEDIQTLQRPLFHLVFHE